MSATSSGSTTTANPSDTLLHTLPINTSNSEVNTTTGASTNDTVQMRGVTVPPATFFDNNTKSVIGIEYNNKVQPITNSSGNSSHDNHDKSTTHIKNTAPERAKRAPDTLHSPAATTPLILNYTQGNDDELIRLCRELLRHIDISYIYCEIYHHTAQHSITIHEKLRLEQLLNHKLNQYIHNEQSMLPLYSKTLVEYYNDTNIDINARIQCIVLIHEKIRYIYSTSVYYYSQSFIRFDTVLYQRCQSLIFLTVMLFLSKIDALHELMRHQLPYICIIDIMSYMEYARINFFGYKIYYRIYFS